MISSRQPDKQPRIKTQRKWLHTKVFTSPFPLSRHMSMVSMAACYWWGPGFKSRQGRELVILYKKELFIQIWIVIWYIKSMRSAYLSSTYSRLIQYEILKKPVTYMGACISIAVYGKCTFNVKQIWFKLFFYFFPFQVCMLVFNNKETNSDLFWKTKNLIWREASQPFWKFNSPIAKHRVNAMYPNLLEAA